jgi:hypothetical protein
MSIALGLLIIAAAFVAFALGAIGVTKLQQASLRRDSLSPGAALPGDAGPSGFQQSPGDTREAYVRKHWQRPGVVANGVTLVDLYDRIAELEKRLAETEQQLASLTPPS